jgi:DNA-binding transcriptional LysR family regulator
MESGDLRVFEAVARLGSIIFDCAREGLGITMMPRLVSERASQNGRLAIHALPRHEALVRRCSFAAKTR